MKNGQRKQKRIIVQQQERGESASGEENLKRGMGSLNDQSVREEREKDDEQQAAATTNESLDQRRHMGGREAQHRRQVVVAAIDILKGAVLKLKAGDKEKEKEQTDG